jgi:hypothetical protein
LIEIEVVKVNTRYPSWHFSDDKSDDTRGSVIVIGSPEFVLSEFMPLRSVRNSVVSNKYYMSEVTWTSDNLEDFIAKRFFKIPAVECIFFSIENGLIEIRTVINKYDKEVAKNIYTAEYDLLETFNDILFDFYIIYRNNRHINDIYPPESVIIFRE